MDSAPTAQLIAFPTYPAPVMAVAQILARFRPSELATFVTVAIDLLDTVTGDADLEVDLVEDDAPPLPREIDYGPGCLLSDPGEDCDDDTEHDGREPDPEYGI